jgi:hypothetical protein
MAVSVGEVAAADIDAILRSPTKFHGERLSVIGVIVGDGPEFELFRNAMEAREMGAPSRSLTVRAQGKWQRQRPFHLHRVRVTGKVNAKRHGVWGNPCEISLETIYALSKGPVATSDIPTGLFRNERSEPVSVRLFNSNTIQGAFDLGPGESVGLPINDGKVQVLNRAGSLIAEDMLGIHRRSKFFDPKHGAFYYRIARNGIEKVLPSKVDYWKWSR